jgi:hypothetical protein
MNRRLTSRNFGEGGPNGDTNPCQPVLRGYNTLMESFRHNLTPVEVKIFLKTAADLIENLAIRYVNKISRPCPHCSQNELCAGAGVSYFCSSFDKTTHEIIVCLHCGYKDLATLTTCERL